MYPGANVGAGQNSAQRNGNGLAPVTYDGAAATNAANLNTYCIGPSVGYLTPYYIGSNWASEAATATTLGANNAVGGEPLAERSSMARSLLQPLSLGHTVVT